MDEMMQQKTKKEIENEWRDSGISSFEGFFLRDDGKVEVENIEDDGTENIVKGVYYKKCFIIPQKEAWDILLDSDDFRNEVEEE